MKLMTTGGALQSQESQWYVVHKELIFEMAPMNATGVID